MEKASFIIPLGTIRLAIHSIKHTEVYVIKYTRDLFALKTA